MAPTKHLITKDELEKLYTTSSSREELCKTLGVSLGTAKYLLSKHDICKRKKPHEYPPLTKRQQEIIVGSLLGDGWLQGSKDKSYNWKFCKKQSENPIGKMDRKSYMEWIFAELDMYSCHLGKSSIKLKFKFYGDKQKIVSFHDFSTHAHPVFTAMAHEWYLTSAGKFLLNKNNRVIKIVPRNINITPLMLAVWFCDDGINEPKLRKSSICTDCFSVNECEYLLERLYKDLNLKCSLQFYQANPRIYIKDAYLDFINIIKPNVIWDCFQYKIDLSEYEPAIQMFGETHVSSKLTTKDVLEMFKMREAGATYKAIGERFGVSTPHAYNVTNKKRWKHI